ncbi:hypothetical protein [Herpetosiphon sp. NSE202]|uniref:hypothetical protein n=1 Tax=Herpetosiphon sp. NSE202 TaxID=3351349 RepID=UPI003644C749
MSGISISKVNQIVSDLKTAEGSALLDQVRIIATLGDSHSRIVVALLELFDAPYTPSDVRTKIVEVLQKEPHASIVNRSSSWKLALQTYIPQAVSVDN